MTLKPSTNPYDFTIVGGGLVGSLLALLLAQRNYTVRLVEKRTAPKPNLANPLDTRALALNYGTVELLKNWGFTDLLQSATYIKEIHVSNQGHRGMVHINAAQENLPYLGVIVPFEILVYALQNTVIKTKALHFYEGEIADPFNTSKIIVGADGTESSVRKALGIELEEYDYHTAALIGKVQVHKQVADCAFERFTPEGPIALLPAGDCLYTMVWVRKTHPTVTQSPSFEKGELLKSLQHAFGYRAGVFVNHGVMKSYPLKRQWAKETYRGKAGLLGNAAHFIHPVAGQGFNLAVRDILVFLEVLDMQQTLDESLWQEYTKRSAFQQKMIKTLTHSFVKGFESHNPAISIGRNILLQCFEASSFARSELNDIMIGKY